MAPLVHRFSEAAKDPQKLAELKIMLNVLCHETSYVDECRMMKSIVLLAVVAACYAFDKESMLKHNKISKEPVGSVDMPSTCEECKSLVHRFSEAAKDPQKLAELKIMLNVLCHETSYVDECRMRMLTAFASHSTCAPTLVLKHSTESDCSTQRER
ncbi:hypothetical protein COOONC_11047 [Cooperia oncophora]